MKKWLKLGWGTSVQHRYVLVILFLYRLLWGFFLYRFIGSIISTVLARFPAAHPNPDAGQLFLIEAQFRLIKTNLANETLLVLGMMLLARMMLTPLLQAGIYYSFCHARPEEGTLVLTGMRKAWKPAVLLYWLEIVLLLLPALWLFPIASELFIASPMIESWLQAMLPYVVGWMFYGFVLRLLFPFMLFSAVSQQGVLPGMRAALRHIWPLLLLALIMAGAGLVASTAATATTLLWSGFFAVLLHQLFHFIRSWLSLWTTASQYHIWHKSA